MITQKIVKWFKFGPTYSQISLIIIDVDFLPMLNISFSSCEKIIYNSDLP